MNTSLTSEQKKERLKSALTGFALGIGLTVLVLHFVFKKRTDMLEAKILKLEGWQ